MIPANWLYDLTAPGHLSLGGSRATMAGVCSQSYGWCPQVSLCLQKGGGERMRTHFHGIAV